MKRPFTRSLLTGLIVVVLAAFAVYKFKFAPASGEIVAEVKSTGTLEARVKTTGARSQNKPYAYYINN
ncbi:MAG: hypothetical protein H7X89_14910 [Rhizobiales bacterium]|nr:hypothetical protein [Hyphomicrobiales bacterium]